MHDAPVDNKSTADAAEAFLEGKEPETVDETPEVDNNLEDDESTAESDEHDPEEASEEPSDTDEEEAEESDDEDSEDEEEEASDSEDEQSAKKPGKWKRLKLRAQESEAKLQALDKDHGELLEHAEYFVQQNENLRAEMEALQLVNSRMRSRLEAYDLSEFDSPAEQRAAELEMQNLQLTRQQQRYAEQQQQLSQQQAHAQAAQQAQAIRSVAEQHGVDPVELYQRHRVVAHTGATLESVAGMLSTTVAAKNARAKAKARVGQSKAPRKMKRGGSGSPGFENSTEGALAFLEAKNS